MEVGEPRAYSGEGKREGNFEQELTEVTEEEQRGLGFQNMNKSKRAVYSPQ